jgi:hypothetical protein
MTEKSFCVFGRRVEVFTTDWRLKWNCFHHNSGHSFRHFGLGYIGIRVWSKKK